MTETFCYNKGCGKKFNEEQNSEGELFSERFLLQNEKNLEHYNEP